jgi:cation diffusion facilitator CzcD-associated flavoprotein CzcO
MHPDDWEHFNSLLNTMSHTHLVASSHTYYKGVIMDGGNCVIDYMIIGAGFMGAVLAERIATQMGKAVMIVEKRNHIGGNAYDYYNEEGILVHKYGPHIFHTRSKQVWDYLSHFTEWRLYHHHVLGMIDDKKGSHSI